MIKMLIGIPVLKPYVKLHLHELENLKVINEFKNLLTDSAPLHVITLCPETVFIVVPQTFHVNLRSRRQ